MLSSALTKTPMVTHERWSQALHTAWQNLSLAEKDLLEYGRPYVVGGRRSRTFTLHACMPNETRSSGYDADDEEGSGEVVRLPEPGRALAHEHGASASYDERD